MKKYQYLASWDDQTLTRVGEPVVVLGDSNISQVEVILPSNFLLDPTKAAARIYFLLPGEKESDFETLETATKDENGDSHVTWTIKHAHTEKGGRLAFSLTIIGDDAQWDSRTVIIPVYESRYQPESEEAEEPYTGRLTALEGSMASIRGEFAEVQEDFEELKETATLGTPIPESLVANMREGHVYIYTGTETGYTAGHVYYYVDGTLTDGGVYGGTAVDTTLTESGKAADAAAVGAEVSAIKEDLADNVNNLNNVERIVQGVMLSEYAVSSGVFITGKSLRSNGSIDDYTHRSVTTYIFCPKGSYIAVNSGYRFNIAEYSGLTASTMTKYTTFGTSRYYIENNCYVRFSIASLDDAIDVDANTAASNYAGFIIASTILIEAENEHNIIDLSGIDIEYGSIDISGIETEAANRVRTKTPLFLKRGTVVTNKSGVGVAWRRYADADGTEFEGKSADFSSGNITIKVSGYYRFIFTQNNWSNGNLSMLVSLTNNDIGIYGKEIDLLKEETNPYVGFPILFSPSEPYSYNGTSIPLDIVDGSGNMLTTLYGWYDELVERFPGHISKSVIGTDQSGEYEIRSYTVNSYTSSAKPKVLWISGIHGSETYTHTVTYMMVKELLENHNTNSVLDFIWSNCTLIVVPIANPWGLANGGIRYNSRGVNLNRNFDADWVYNDAQYDNSGSAPESESETRAIVSLIENNMDAIFAVTKHDSDTFVSQSYRFGYNVASFNIDRLILRTLWARMDTEIKKKYAWVLNDVPTTATFNLFRNLSTSDTKGSMDKWFNTIGIHGGLYEVSRPASNDFTTAHKQDFLSIGLETSVNMVASAVEKNQTILKANKLTYRYKQILND